MKDLHMYVLCIYRIRVVCYNILADLYADSDFARSKLFSSCPPYAIDMDYRKQLLIKELIGKYLQNRYIVKDKSIR